MPEIQPEAFSDTISLSRHLTKPLSALFHYVYTIYFITYCIIQYPVATGLPQGHVVQWYVCSRMDPKPTGCQSKSVADRRLFQGLVHVQTETWKYNKIWFTNSLDWTIKHKKTNKLKNHLLKRLNFFYCEFFLASEVKIFLHKIYKCVNVIGTIFLIN